MTTKHGRDSQHNRKSTHIWHLEEQFENLVLTLVSSIFQVKRLKSNRIKKSLVFKMSCKSFLILSSFKSSNLWLESDSSSSHGTHLWFHTSDLCFLSSIVFCCDSRASMHSTWKVTHLYAHTSLSAAGGQPADNDLCRDQVVSLSVSHSNSCTYSFSLSVFDRF